PLSPTIARKRSRTADVMGAVGIEGAMGKAAPGMYSSLFGCSAPWGAPAFVLVFYSGRWRDDPSTGVALAGMSPAVRLVQILPGLLNASALPRRSRIPYCAPIKFGLEIMSRFWSPVVH